MKLISDYELAEFRALAQEQMPSSCTVWRAAGNSSTAGGAVQERTYTAVYTDHPFKLDGDGRGTRTVKIGNEEIQVAVRLARLPAPTTVLHDGDLVEITDGEHTGVFVKVIEATGQDDAVEVRVPVYEVSRPKELRS